MSRIDLNEVVRTKGLLDLELIGKVLDAKRNVSRDQLVMKRRIHLKEENNQKLRHASTTVQFSRGFTLTNAEIDAKRDSLDES